MSSRTPDGGYMPTFASNYMLDGFDFSEEYGEGPLMNHKIPTTSRTTKTRRPQPPPLIPAQRTTHRRGNAQELATGGED